MWQVSGSHGSIDVDRAVEDMFTYYDAGLTTFDMADIYGPAEDIFGRFLLQLKAKRGNKAAEKIQGKQIKYFDVVLLTFKALTFVFAA